MTCLEYAASVMVALVNAVVRPLGLPHMKEHFFAPCEVCTPLRELAGRLAREYAMRLEAEAAVEVSTPKITCRHCRNTGMTMTPLCNQLILAFMAHLDERLAPLEEAFAEACPSFASRVGQAPSHPTEGMSIMESLGSLAAVGD